MNYTVQPGDTLYGVASRFNVSVDAIIRANNLVSPYYLYVGQRLYIPVSYPPTPPTPPGQPTPPAPRPPVGNVDRRLERLERRMDRLEQRVRRLEQG